MTSIKLKSPKKHTQKIVDFQPKELNFEPIVQSYLPSVSFKTGRKSLPSLSENLTAVNLYLNQNPQK